MGKNNPLLHTSPTGRLSWDVESDNYPNTCLLLAGQGKLLCLPDTNAARNFQFLAESIIRTLNAVLRKRQKKRKKMPFGGCLQLSYGLVPKDIKILVLIRCLFTHLTSLGGRGSITLFYCNTETNKLFLKKDKTDYSKLCWDHYFAVVPRKREKKKKAVSW